MSSYTVATGKSFGAGVSGISATKQEGNANANAGSGNQNSNAGSGNGNNANSNLANANNATTKLSASSVTAQLGTNSQFALDKAYSVLGTGNVKVGNQTLESLTAEKQANGDNSLNSLKRTTDKATLTLANVSTGTSVSAALDTRLLSKEGWQSIKEDAQTSSEFGIAIGKVVAAKTQNAIASIEGVLGSKTKDEVAQVKNENKNFNYAYLETSYITASSARAAAALTKEELVQAGKSGVREDDKDAYDQAFQKAFSQVSGYDEALGISKNHLK